MLDRSECSTLICDFVLDKMVEKSLLFPSRLVELEARILTLLSGMGSGEIMAFLEGTSDASMKRGRSVGCYILVMDLRCP